MNKFDKFFFNDGIQFLAGVDEAGRGPLAGPVVAASVIFKKNVHIRGVKDSKLIPAEKREELYDKITAKALAYAVSVVDSTVIDEINILRASLLAMKQAVEQLKIKPDLVLVDGNKKFIYENPVIPIVDGDAKSFSIGAASIIAKVTRDRIMKMLAEQYPFYLWEKNKGYATKEHRDLILKYGHSPLHRMTFLRKLYKENEQLNLELV